MTVLFYTNASFFAKYVYGTFSQLGFTNKIHIKTFKDPSERKIYYYSEEHENLSYTGLRIFEKNFLTGSGLKNYYSACNDLIIKNKQNDLLPHMHKRNKLKCSTHPHNTYIQLLSDIGFLGFALISFFFINTLFQNLKIVFLGTYKNNTYVLAYYFLSVGITINILPFVPAGSFFNNWVCYIIIYPLGYWLYLKKKL